MSVEPREMARRLLPWVLAPRFNNVITSVEVRGTKAVTMRNVEIYETSVGRVMVPGAGLMLYVPYLNAEYTIHMTGKDKGHIRINNVKGFVAGFMPNGKYAKFTEKAFEQGVVGKKIEFTGATPSDFSVNMVARRLARLEAAKYFASKIKYALRDEGWFFLHVGTGSIKTVYIIEGNVQAKVVLSTNFFRVYYKDKERVAPGIVPGVLSFFNDKELSVIEDDKTRDVILDFLDRVSSVGKNFTSLSILQKASRSTFVYVIGDAEIPESVAKELKKTNGDKWVWVTGAPTYSGVRSNIYVDPESKKVLLSLTFVPFNPPASLVLNYPPFHIAPLAAMVKERKKQLEFLADVVPERLSKKGIDATIYVDELDPLADANVTFDDIKRVLKEGYPRLDTLEKLLSKMSRIEYIGEVASMTYGVIRKIDELIISEIKPRKEKVETPEEAEEREAEEIRL